MKLTFMSRKRLALLFLGILFFGCSPDLDLLLESSGEEEVLGAVSVSAQKDIYTDDETVIDNSLIRVSNGIREGYLSFDLTGVDKSLNRVTLQFRVTADSGSGKLDIYYTDFFNWEEENVQFDELPTSSKLVGQLRGNFDSGKDYSIVLDRRDFSSDRFTLILRQSLGGAADDFAFYSSENESGFGPSLNLFQDNEVTEDQNFDDSQDSDDFGYDNVDMDNAILLSSLKAFPSAQGHGAVIITGGENGKIFYVESFENTNEGYYDADNDIYRGTFKYALKHPQRGYIVFRVGGVINAEDDRDYLITGAGNKTIMGGSAPFPGVLFYGHRFRLHQSSNWIIRGMTFLGGSRLEIRVHDAFTASRSTEILLSDNNFGWGGDEVYSLERSSNFIVQRNIAVEARPEHNTGSVFYPDTDGETGIRGSGSVHNNGYFHISHRFPNLQGLEEEYFDVVNQFAYNMGSRISSNKFQLNVNHINGYYKAGPRTNSDIGFKWNASSEASSLWKPEPKIYSSGNIITNSVTSPDYDNRRLWKQHINGNGFTQDDPLPNSFFSSMHPLGKDISIKSAQDAYDFNIVGKNIGSRYYMSADGRRIKYFLPVIEEYIDDAINGTDFAFRNNASLFALSQSDISNPENPYEDSDYDGMADVWEEEHGLVVGIKDGFGSKRVWVFEGRTFLNDAGYSNLQMFNDYIHGGFVVLD